MAIVFHSTKTKLVRKLEVNLFRKNKHEERLEKTCLNYGQHTHSSVLVSCCFVVVSMIAPE